MRKITEITKEVYEVIEKSGSLKEATEKLNELDYEVNEQELESLLKAEKKMPLTDEELEMINGGTEWYSQKLWLDRSKVQYIFNVGDTVEVASGFGFGTTVKCEIKELGIGYFSLANGGNAYFDTYYCENKEYTWYFYDGWKTRDLIEKR